MHEFSRCPGKIFESRLSEMPFPGPFGERFYRILMVGKRHCDILEALTNVFALQPEPGGLHLAHWGWGPQVRPVRTEPIVVACEQALWAKESLQGSLY